MECWWRSRCRCHSRLVWCCCLGLWRCQFPKQCLDSTTGEATAGVIYQVATKRPARWRLPQSTQGTATSRTRHRRSCRSDERQFVAGWKSERYSTGVDKQRCVVKALHNRGCGIAAGVTRAPTGRSQGQPALTLTVQPVWLRTWTTAASGACCSYHGQRVAWLCKMFCRHLGR